MSRVNQVQAHLSYSAVSQFRNCRRSWFSQHVLGKKQTSGEGASFGLAFEAQVIARLGAVNEKKPEEGEEDRAVLTDPAAIRVMDHAVETYFNSPGAWKAGDPGTTVAQRKIEITPAQWGTLADMYGAAGEIHLPIIGYIDLLRVDSLGLQRVVKDLKTTKDSQFKPEWLIQTLLYAMAERAQKIAVDVLIRPQERATKKPRPADWLPNFQTAFYEYRVTDEALRWMMTWIGSAASEMRVAEQSSLERMPASPGYFCAWCPEADTCEANMAAGLKPCGGTKSGKGEEE